MPQMKPMNWIILYLILNLTIMLMTTLNYFFNFNKKKINFHKKFNNKNNKSWKW